MKIILNSALEPGFVAVEKNGIWEYEPINIGRDVPFIGVAVERLLPNHELQKFKQIIVINGPGSSTGLRIVCSYANGLQLVSGAEMLFVSSFEFVSMMYSDQPTRILFPQSSSRVILAEKEEGGVEWSMSEPEIVPTEVREYAANDLSLSIDKISRLADMAQKIEIAVPVYWTAAQVTKAKK